MKEGSLRAYNWWPHIQGLLIGILFFITQVVSSTLMIAFIKVQSAGVTSQQQLTDLALLEMFRSMFIVESIFVIGLMIVYRKQIIPFLKWFSQNWFEYFLKLAMYYVVLTFVAIFASILDSILFSNLTEDIGANQAVIEKALQDTPSITAMLAIGFVGPIVEEYVFRYGLMTKLFHGFNRYIAAILAAIVFSYVHIGFAQASSSPAVFAHLMLSYLPVALCLCMVYAREQKLCYSIGLHMINNIQAMVLIIAAANM